MTRRAKHHPDCNHCGAPADVSFKCTLNNSADWLYRECSYCEQPFCVDCCEPDTYEEDKMICIPCQSDRDVA